MSYFMPTPHLTTHAQPEALVLTWDATNNSHCADAQGFSKLDGLFLDLLGQLTGGGQDDGIGALIRLLNPAVEEKPHVEPQRNSVKFLFVYCRIL